MRILLPSIFQINVENGSKVLATVDLLVFDDSLHLFPGGAEVLGAVATGTGAVGGSAGEFEWITVHDWMEVTRLGGKGGGGCDPAAVAEGVEVGVGDGFGEETHCREYERNRERYIERNIEGEMSRD
jgi:hypothetical protein